MRKVHFQLVLSSAPMHTCCRFNLAEVSLLGKIEPSRTLPLYLFPYLYLGNGSRAIALTARSLVISNDERQPMSMALDSIKLFSLPWAANPVSQLYLCDGKLAAYNLTAME